MKTLSILCIFLALFSSCDNRPKHQLVHQQLMIDIDSVQTKLLVLNDNIKRNKSIIAIQKHFLASREAYKEIEFLTDYYFPSASKTVNGPAIDEFEEEDGKIVPAQGFQVIEEMIFSQYDTAQKAELLTQTTLLSSNVMRLKKLASTTELTDSHVFDAMRLEIFRMITLGITGFDSPVAQNSISEAKSVLKSLKKYLHFYNQDSDNQLFKIIENGEKYLNKNQDFNQFSRAEFILNIANPLSKTLRETQLKLNISLFSEKRGLRTTAVTLFEKNAFDVIAFSSNQQEENTQHKITLGKEIFNSPVLSSNQNRSCASCHQAEKAFTDSQTLSSGLTPNTFLKRNTPTILNVAFQRSYFYDSRVSYLEDQVRDVVENKDEMHGSLKNAVLMLQKSKEYLTKFNEIYPQKPINEFQIQEVLSTYIRSLSNYDSRFDKYMQGVKNALNDDEIKGFNIFTGKAKCATCHFIPLTNGTVPPNFDKSESEVLGVPNSQNKLDSDWGKYNISKAPIHRYAFKTPTLRNVALTAPYMHNGVYKTLEEVVDFYNKGGGNGLGFNLENQTLPTDKLNLTSSEKQHLVAFMKSLTDVKYENQAVIVKK